MRRISPCLLALVFAFAAVARGEDCPEKACCKQATACSKAGCPASACAAQGECQTSACATKAGCQGSACAAQGECQATACAKSGGCCAATARIQHLRQALKHLEAAGMEAEARQVSQALAWETIAQKQVELARLHAEIQALRQAAGPPRQVMLHVKLMEVSLSDMQAKGIKLPQSCAGTCPGAELECLDCDGKANKTLAFRVCDHKAAAKFVKSLEQGHHVKVFAEPTLVTVEGRPCTYAAGCPVGKSVAGKDAKCCSDEQMVGTQVDAEVKMLGDRKLRLKIRPRFSVVDLSKTVQVDGVAIPAVKVREMNTDCELETGQAVVVGGPIQERTAGGKRHEVQLILVVTPEAVHALPPLPTAQAPSQTQAK
jgi:hypothetical protein